MSNALSAYTTIGIGGRARRLEVVSRVEELAELSVDGVVLGRGSNVLVSDDGYDGTVVINRCGGMTIDGGFVTAESGVRLSVLCNKLAEEGLSGLEWAVGIPGSVGGAVRMNAGAFGGQLADRLVYADIVIGGSKKRLYKSELAFGYRTSGLKVGDTVLSAAFLLDKADAPAVKKRCKEFTLARRLSQPEGRSAGSVFKNPPGVFVGKLLDEAGLKGLRQGGAVISAKHANIIVNTGGATAKDVCFLISVMKNVLRERGVTAREEIVYLGFDPDFHNNAGV